MKECNMKNLILAFAAAYTLTACLAVNPAETTRPAISGYNGDTVTIQADGNEAYNTRPTNDIIALATSTCGRGGKSAEYASTTTSVAYFRNEHLFICL
jgi:hypothetical protein